MLIFVVLGNRINDDGSMSELMSVRMKITLSAIEKFRPDKIILSGGVANSNIDVSEARMMYDYLKVHGVAEEIMVMEDKSMTTKQNAEFSVPIAFGLGATELLLITSPEHMNRKFLNPIKLFKKQLSRHTEIMLRTYCGN